MKDESNYVSDCGHCAGSQSFVLSLVSLFLFVCFLVFCPFPSVCLLPTFQLSFFLTSFHHVISFLTSISFPLKFFMLVVVVLVLTPCGLVDCYRRFGERVTSVFWIT